MPSSAAISLNLDLSIEHVDRFSGSASGSTVQTKWSGLGWIEPMFSPELIAYTLYAPDGSVSSVKKPNATSIFGTPTNETTFAAWKDDATRAAWTLDVTTSLGDSRYALTPKVSLAESSYVTATMTSPAPYQSILPSATFAWTPSLYYSYGYLLLNDAAGYRAINLGPSQNQFYQPPSSLPYGSATLELEIAANKHTPISMSTTLLSGVDQGPITATTSYMYEAYVPYQVVASLPEPVGITALGAIGLTLRRRRQPL